MRNTKTDKLAELCNKAYKASKLPLLHFISESAIQLEGIFDTQRDCFFRILDGEVYHYYYSNELDKWFCKA